MADLAAALHRASAVVALTGSERGRQQGKALYATARKVAQSCMMATGDPGYPWDMTKKDDEVLEKAIDTYKTPWSRKLAARARRPTGHSDDGYRLLDRRSPPARPAVGCP